MIMPGDVLAATKEALAVELEDYCKEIVRLIEPLNPAQLWAKPVEPGNSAGHLILHLTGNLNHYIGAQLGRTGYVRDREREFSETEPPEKASLLGRLQDAVALFRRVVSGMSAEELTNPFPEPKFGTNIKALVHIVSHFGLHRGQITYLARLAQKQLPT